jgi:hypothetical protein
MCRAFDQLDSNTLYYSPSSPDDPDDVKDDLAYAAGVCHSAAKQLKRLIPILDQAPRTNQQRYDTMQVVKVVVNVLELLADRLDDHCNVLGKEAKQTLSEHEYYTKLRHAALNLPEE